MALEITPTPELKGVDAKRFREKMAENSKKKVSPKEIAKMRKLANAIFAKK